MIRKKPLPRRLEHERQPEEKSIPLLAQTGQEFSECIALSNGGIRQIICGVCMLWAECIESVHVVYVERLSLKDVILGCVMVWAVKTEPKTVPTMPAHYRHSNCVAIVSGHFNCLVAHWTGESGLKTFPSVRYYYILHSFAFLSNSTARVTTRVSTGLMSSV